MKKITTLAYLILTTSSQLYSSDGASTTPSYEDNPFWRRVAAESGYRLGDTHAIKMQIQERLRNSSSDPLSKDEYKLMHTPTAKGGIGSMWHEESEGQGVPILLFENSGINHQGVRVSPRSQISSLGEFSDHGAGMASLIGQISPKAQIIVIHTADLPKINEFPDVRILNFSNSITENALSSYIPFLNNKIIVKASGNNAENLSSNGWSPSISDFILFAGNLRQDLRVTASSGKPGDMQYIQNNFLWVTAQDIMCATGLEEGNQYSPISGTSLAAAILSGAVAQMMERFPEFSSIEIKECLLKSADQDFIQIFEDGHDGVHVSPKHTAPGVAIDAYNPSIWGKGILNLKNAIIYGNLKRKQKQTPTAITARSHRLDRAIQEIDLKKNSNLRFQMMEKINQERTNGALLIQNNWKKRKDNVKSCSKRDPLTLDPSKPGFTYERALSKTSSNFIPELTALEEKQLRGILSKPSSAQKSRKIKVLEPRPLIFETYPFLEKILDSKENLPNMESFLEFPEKAAQSLLEKFGENLSTLFKGEKVTGITWNGLNFEAITTNITVLERFADILALEKIKGSFDSSFENIKKVERFALFLLKHEQSTPALKQAVLEFLNILKSNSFFGYSASLSQEFLHALYTQNILDAKIKKVEIGYHHTTGQAHGYIRQISFHEADFFTLSQIEKVVSSQYFEKLIRSEVFFLSALRESVGYSDSSNARMIKILDFFTRYGSALDQEKRNEAFKKSLSQFELFYDQKCSHEQFNLWVATSTQLGVSLSKKDFQGRDIFE